MTTANEAILLNSLQEFGKPWVEPYIYKTDTDPHLGTVWQQGTVRVLALIEY